MSLLFNRSTRVSFGKRGSKGVAVTQLYTEFEIERSLERNANRAKIKISNLSEQSRAVLAEKDIIVRFEAGYGGELGQVFIGEITKVKSEKMGNTWVTEIESGDGQGATNEAKISAALAPGAPATSAIELLANKMGLGLGTVKGLDASTFPNGLSLDGLASNRMDEITAKMGTEWSIQDNQLQVLPRNEVTQDLGFFLSPDTGLIGSPTRDFKYEKAEVEGVKTGEKQRMDGVKVTALMNSSLKPGCGFFLKSRNISGFMKIRKAKYTGDNRSGKFYVEMECLEVTKPKLTKQRLNIVGQTLLA